MKYSAKYDSKQFMTHFRLHIGLHHTHVTIQLLKIFKFRRFHISPLPTDFHPQQITKHPAYSSDNHASK